MLSASSGAIISTAQLHRHPDQIETGTLMIAAAATHGDVELTGCIPTHMEALSAKLLEMGARVTESDDTLRVRGTLCGYRGVNIKTQVYPGFPTDLQQPMSTLLTTAMGQSIVRETIFESRLKHLTEIGHMGAHVQFVDNATAIIEGVPELYGAPVTATDLRAGAALVIAGLMARGVTEIYEPEYIDRGYEHLEDKLCSLGRGNPAREVRVTGFRRMTMNRSKFMASDIDIC